MIEDYLSIDNWLTNSNYAVAPPPNSKLLYTDEDGNNIDIIDTIKTINENYDKIMERLAILDDPRPEKLARFKALKEAYIKYKFLEALYGEEDDA